MRETVIVRGGRAITGNEMPAFYNGSNDNGYYHSLNK